MMTTTPALDLTQAAMRERVESARMRSKPMSTVPFGFETGAVVLPTPALSPQVTLESALQGRTEVIASRHGRGRRDGVCRRADGFGPSNEKYLEALPSS